jgi:hypothetical protein
MQIRITKSRAALAALFVLAGVGLGNLLSPLVGSALATVGSVTNISDHSSSAYFAKVSSDGKLAVGDGSGPLSVDGTVSTRPSPPTSPWSASADINNGGTFLAGPSAAPINVTSLSLSTNAPSGSGLIVRLDAYYVASSATSCAAPTFDQEPWLVYDIGDGVTPVSFTFPTPLQYKPPANKKGCLFGLASTSQFVRMNAVGFYGG